MKSELVLAVSPKTMFGNGQTLGAPERAFASNG